jgi:hypothetical protein
MHFSHQRISALLIVVTFGLSDPARSMAAVGAYGPDEDGSVTKSVLPADPGGENVLREGAWQALDKGLARERNEFVGDNRSDQQVKRGVVQHVALNQTRPQPLIASACSKAQNVSGTCDPDYAVYIDLVYNDGTELWGQTAGFRTGTHDWQREELIIFPERPIKTLSFCLLFREHAGKVRFREPSLRPMKAAPDGVMFDGLPVRLRGRAKEGFQVRDVTAGGDFVRISGQAIGLQLEVKPSLQTGAACFDVTLRDTTGKDRAVTLLYAIPVSPQGVRWFEDPRREVPVEPAREYVRASSFRAGVNGRLSSYPLGALALPGDKRGLGLGIDMARPAFYRIGYNSGTAEFWIAYDLGLTPEKPAAQLRFYRFSFESAWGFRSALAEYYQVVPEAFRRRISEQGLWMPFASISRIKGWEDFGFRFKEGNDETAWDDAHAVLTFHYTEPLTWWMRMPRAMPRTIEAALGESRRLAQRGRREARALLTSGYYNAEGVPAARFRNEPWNEGAVWSMNSMPGIPGEMTDFKSKWNPQLRQRLYESTQRGELDGEYIDSSEGYVTDELDFRRDHFAAAETPLVFARDTHRPALFRGLIAFEYVRAIAGDVHGMGKLMMANSTPARLCWLAPMLDVMGTETDWNPRGQWRPMSDADLLYRRALSKGKPYCFLMNTAFEEFSHELVERYMKRALAFGFFPGFFSHNASEGHYFTRAELYERDRPLFKKYVPLCKRVSEAGWEPITQARSNDERVHLERFGDQGTRYLTVFNDSQERRTTTITLETRAPRSSRELVRGGTVFWTNEQARIPLDGDDVAVLELLP